MNEQKTASPTEVEKKLEHMFGSIQADEDFTSRLEQNLQHSYRTKSRPTRALRPAWALLAIALLALASVVALLGPERVLAETRRILGYLPGFGFVDPEQIRVLAEPVEIERDGVTLRIEQVVADPERTRVMFTVTGLPEDRPPENSSPRYSLILADGNRKIDIGGHFRSSENHLEGKLEFFELPIGTEEITLVLPRLPTIAEGIAPEDWSIPLQLQEARQAVNAYRPINAQVTIRSLMVDVIEAAHSPMDTGIKIRYQWDQTEPGEFCGMSWQLSDETGRIYSRLETQGPEAPMPLAPSPTPNPASTREMRYRFEPLSENAEQAVLKIQSICWLYPGQGSFVLDPGPNPQVGQTWTFDPDHAPVLQAGGARLHVLSARLEKAPENYEQNTYLLVLSMRQELPVENVDIWPLISTDISDAGISFLPPQEGIIEASHFLNRLPDSPLTVKLEESRMLFSGAWEIRWTIPK